MYLFDSLIDDETKFICIALWYSEITKRILKLVSVIEEFNEIKLQKRLLEIYVSCEYNIHVATSEKKPSLL